MDFRTIVDITLVLNLVSSIFNVFLYGYGYHQVNKAQVDGKLKLTKRTLLFEFIAVTLVAILFSIVFFIVLFDRSHTNDALYLLNFTLLFFNLAFNVNAGLLALIVENGKDK